MGGDASKVVFGFCNGDCPANDPNGGFNVNGIQATNVMQDVTSAYPCNGGAFFWVAHNDVGGLFSDPLFAEVNPNAGCSSTPQTTTTDATTTM